jgi:hypothetical protein
MAEWQPIETAPKEGAFLVLNGADIGLALVKPWCIADLEGVTEGAAWVGQKPYETGMSLWLGGNDPSDATHWMPLPDAPKGE